MTRTLRLREFQLTSAVALAPNEVDALRRLVPALNITPTIGLSGHFDLVPGSTVGAARTGELDVVISPKIPIDRVFFMLSYALDSQHWKDTFTGYGTELTLVEALVHSYVRVTKAALRRGLLQGYVTVEDRLTTIRGRVRFDEQIRRQPALPLPVYVQYDDFTEDIVENRLLKAATHALIRLPLRSEVSRRLLRVLLAQFEGISLVRFNPRDVPEPVITRLDSHYASALRLARVILQNTSLELRHGGVTGAAVLFDMNKVFEDFVVTSLRDALDLRRHELRQGARGRSLTLDAARRVRLEPDLSLWRDRQCLFVGDVKYKRVAFEGVNHPDLYQLLAYTIATQLPAGLLVYAQGEGEQVEHEVTAAGKTLVVRTLDLAGTPDDILTQVSQLARLIRTLAMTN